MTGSAQDVVGLSLLAEPIAATGFSLMILLLGAMAKALISGSWTQVLNARSLGYLLVTFLTFCIPITLSAYSCYSETEDVTGLGIMVPSVFLAGFASRRYADLALRVGHE